MLVFGCVVVTTFVKKLNCAREGQKAVGEACWNVDFVLFSRRETNTGPFSKIRRADPDIDCNIQGFTLDDSAKLGLRMMQLVVESAESSANREGVVVLNECVGNAQMGELGSMVGF